MQAHGLWSNEGRKGEQMLNTTVVAAANKQKCLRMLSDPGGAIKDSNN